MKRAKSSKPGSAGIGSVNEASAAALAAAAVICACEGLLWQATDAKARKTTARVADNGEMERRNNFQLYRCLQHL